MDVPTPESVRFVGIDLHKQSVTVAAVDAHHQVLLRPLRIPLVQFAAWAATHLFAPDHVVVEATTTAWWLVDLLQPQVRSVVVAHPRHLHVITAAAVKTDPRDALKLATLLAADLIPAVWIPPVPVRELRGLIRHRLRLVSQRSHARNRLHSVLHRHHLVPPAGTRFALKARSWWLQLDLPSSERLRILQDLHLHDALDTLIIDVEEEIARLSMTEPWATQIPFLIHIPGIGVLAAMTIMAAIGDVRRFPSAKQLVGYAGLGARVHASGATMRTGRITKEGRRELRGGMVEAAWVAVATHPHWKAQFARLEPRIGTQKAIVAIARKLLVVVWHVLTNQEVDRHGEEQAIARKLAGWASKYRLARRVGLSRGAFVRRQLDRLRIGATMRDVHWCGRVTPLPPVGEDTAPPYTRHRQAPSSS